MSDSARLVDHLVEVWPDVVQGARPAVRQLHEWSGGFPSSTSGAAPASPAPQADDPGPSSPGDGMPALDRARRDLVRIYELLDRVVAATGDLGDSLGGERLPHRLEARLAFVQWQINKLADRRLPASSVNRLERVVRDVNELDKVVRNSQPAATSGGLPAGGCIAHARVGVFVAVDARFRRHDLCRPCGECKATIGQLPPPEMVRWADKHGWRSAKMPAQLRRFNVAPRRAKTGGVA